MSEYDVIIIGAGPAGIACANMLKNSHLSVLIVDKNLDSYTKPCAGALTKNVNKFYYPEDKIREFTKAYLYINNHVYIKTIAPIRTISRKDLFTHMISKIKKFKNITIKKEDIQRITDTAVFSKNNNKMHYKYLVGADGSLSIVRKFLKLPSRYMTGIYFEIPKVTEVMAKVYDPYKEGCEYIWIFPHKDHTNIGMGFNPEKIVMKQAKQVFFNFLHKKNIVFSQLKLYTAPLNYYYRGCVFKNIYLIGDAAGLTMKTSGEGISQAIISGEEIGWKILHPEYSLDRLNKLTRSIRRSNLLYSFYHSFLFGFKLLIKLRTKKCTSLSPSLF